MTNRPVPGHEDKPQSDPTDLPDDTPEPEPGDDTIEVPLD